MMSVMKDKTMGYTFDPIFPYITKKMPGIESNSIHFGNLRINFLYLVLDLNEAAAKSQDFILSESTVAFELDFTTKT